MRLAADKNQTFSRSERRLKIVTSSARARTIHHSCQALCSHQPTLTHLSPPVVKPLVYTHSLAECLLLSLICCLPYLLICNMYECNVM